MNEKNLPNWMLVAIVAAFGELSYWLFNRFGMGPVTKASIVATALIALLVAVVFVMRLVKRPSTKHTVEK